MKLVPYQITFQCSGKNFELYALLCEDLRFIFFRFSKPPIKEWSMERTYCLILLFIAFYWAFLFSCTAKFGIFIFIYIWWRKEKGKWWWWEVVLSENKKVVNCLWFVSPENAVRCWWLLLLVEDNLVLFYIPGKAFGIHYIPELHFVGKKSLHCIFPWLL